MCNPQDFPTNWQNLPNLHIRNHNPRFPEYSAACPINGGHDRIWIRPNGKPDGDGRGFIWCRTCGMSVQLSDTPRNLLSWRLVRPIPVRLLSPEIALRYHDDLGPHRRYFQDRGISDEMIDRHKLGWKREWRRYSVPCWLLNNTGELELWGIQLRASWKDPDRKYISEPGSHNKQVFNARICAGQTQPLILIIEGPLDTLALWSQWRIPAVASFQGNNRHRDWEPGWNHWLLSDDRVIVPDNDADPLKGELIACNKQLAIPHSRIQRLPPGCKDIGEYIVAGGNVPGWLVITTKEVQTTQED